MSNVQKYQLGKTIWEKDPSTYSFYRWSLSDEYTKNEMMEEELLLMGATPLPKSKEEEEIEEISPGAVYSRDTDVDRDAREKINELIKAVNQHSKAITALQRNK